MPSSWSSSLRFELQFTGENVNLWGDKLNAVLQHADYAAAGWLTKVLTADTALSVANAADDEARAAMVKFTGAGAFTVTIPSVSKHYVVWNACSGALNVTTGAGAAATILAGEKVALICDGAGVWRVQPTDFAAQRLTSLADPVAPQDAATKAYADNLAFTANAGVLPGQTGNAGKFLTTDGVSAGWSTVSPDQAGNAGKFLSTDGVNQNWRAPSTADLADIGAYTAQRNAFAIAAAIAL
ncbi:MAG TPA: hypothetical protein VFN88_08480 [Caulobacteraceae bacterium]|uniref:hypothetical protein n=1 Tax=Phenylobacterium sp. TaxID=1871053 RepID=UPI002621C973|nr:hypothetical protein [Phenylobacterium sp.]HET9160634.1 hypothetical protein [Caulobacteraceae bacterium]